MIDHHLSGLSGRHDFEPTVWPCAVKIQREEEITGQLVMPHVILEIESESESESESQIHF